MLIRAQFHKNAQVLKSFRRVVSFFVVVTFITSVILPPSVSAQVVLNLPAPGVMINPTPGFMPVLVKGMTLYPENPLAFDFIIDNGDSNLKGEELKDEYTKLIKYFLASLTVPEDELWVNLSPTEKDRIVGESLKVTEMGKDMLAQDYILKQLTASLMYPEKELGKKFWDKIYKEVKEKFGTTEIPVDTFNKVWIVPEKAVVYHHGNSVFVVESRLKVMLESDYKALQHASKIEDGRAKGEEGKEKMENKNGKSENQFSLIDSQSSIIKEIILPEIEKEVNEGQTFANLRQIFNSMILAAWYKRNLKESLLGKVYMNQGKIKGVDLDDKTVSEKIYNQYLEAFKVGVYNYIKEDYDPSTQEVIQRKYFSGGVNSSPLFKIDENVLTETSSPIGDLPDGKNENKVRFDLVEYSDGNKEALNKVAALPISIMKSGQFRTSVGVGLGFVLLFLNIACGRIDQPSYAMAGQPVTVSGKNTSQQGSFLTELVIYVRGANGSIKTTRYFISDKSDELERLIRDNRNVAVEYFRKKRIRISIFLPTEGVEEDAIVQIVSASAGDTGAADEPRKKIEEFVKKLSDSSVLDAAAILEAAIKQLWGSGMDYSLRNIISENPQLLIDIFNSHFEAMRIILITNPGYMTTAADVIIDLSEHDLNLAIKLIDTMPDEKILELFHLAERRRGQDQDSNRLIEELTKQHGDAWVNGYKERVEQDILKSYQKAIEMAEGNLNSFLKSKNPSDKYYYDDLAGYTLEAGNAYWIFISWLKSSSKNLESFEPYVNKASEYYSDALKLMEQGYGRSAWNFVLAKQYYFTINKDDSIIKKLEKWEEELRLLQPNTSLEPDSPVTISSPVSIRNQIIGSITALSLLWRTVVPANALEMSIWEKFDDPAERSRMVDKIALGIINLGDDQTGIAPSHVGHPGFEKLKFLYDAAVDALILKAAGKQKEAEKILDYPAERLKIPFSEVREHADTNGIAGIIKVWGTDEYNVRGLINALDRTSTKRFGQGMLEYYSTPGPMSFIVMGFLNVNKERYLPAAIELGNALLSLQRSDGGLKDGDRSPNRVHIEPHMDSFDVFLQLYQATNDKKWKTAAENAWQYFVKSDAYDPANGIIWQGMWESGVNKVFATDAYSWTMAGAGGDRMSLYELEKFTETMLSKSLTQVTLELPDGKTKTITLVDFTDPRDPQVMKDREGFHPMGTVEWAGGVITALQKNAVRFWLKGNPQEKEKARHYKALAEYLTANSLYSFYEIPGLEGLLSFYATGQNVPTGHGWKTPFFYVKGPKPVKGGSLVSAWPALSIQGLNPFVLNDEYKKSYDKIPLTKEDREQAIRFVALSVVNRSFKETVPTTTPDAATQIVEPGNYNGQMWNAFVRGDYKKAIEWAQRVVNDPDWIRLARRDQEQKAKEIGGLVRYPWGAPTSSVPELEAAIWKYPLLNEVAAAMWSLAASHFELGNKTESKKWMRRIIEEVPYHQIFAPDGPGYWNALISWEYNPGNVRRDAQMGPLYREVLREMGLNSAAPKEIIIPVKPTTPARVPLTERQEVPVPVPSQPERPAAGARNLLDEGGLNPFSGSGWASYGLIFTGYNNLSGATHLRVTFTLTNGNQIIIQALDRNLSPGLPRNEYVVDKGPGTHTVDIPLKNFGRVDWKTIHQLAFHYGAGYHGRQLNKPDTQLEIQAVELLTKTSSPMTKDEMIENPGGINFDPKLLDLQIKRDANFVPLPLPQQPIENMHIEGFIPVIINIQPVTNLPMLLGMADTEDKNTDETRSDMKARDPEKISVL